MSRLVVDDEIHPVLDGGRRSAFHDGTFADALSDNRTLDAPAYENKEVTWDHQVSLITFEREKPKKKYSDNLRNIILAVLNLFFNIVVNISLPIYAGTMEKVGGDMYALLAQAAIYFTLLFILLTYFAKVTIDRSISMKPTASFKILLLMGFLTTMNGILVVFASPPDRTPPYLQGILQTTVIPYTIIFRLLILRKGK